MLRVLRGRPRLEIGHVEVGESVVDEAVHGPGLAEHVLVHQSGDEIRREGDHEGLKREGDRQAAREAHCRQDIGNKNALLASCHPIKLPRGETMRRCSYQNTAGNNISTITL